MNDWVYIIRRGPFFGHKKAVMACMSYEEAKEWIKANRVKGEHMFIDRDTTVSSKTQDEIVDYIHERMKRKGWE